MDEVPVHACKLPRTSKQHRGASAGMLSSSECPAGQRHHAGRRPVPSTCGAHANTLTVTNGVLRTRVMTVRGHGI
eukprot:6067564-Alexandrium_andersonii.AAC.1